MLEESSGESTRMLVENSHASLDLWINLAAAGDQNTVRSPKNNFQRVWHPRG